MEFRGFIRSVELRRERVESFDRYPFSLPALKGLDRLELHPGVTIICGENGSGKSTLLEGLAVACGLDPGGGSRSFHRPETEARSDLHAALRLVRNPERERRGFFFRAETFHQLGREIREHGLGEYGWDDLEAKSRGQAFLYLIERRFFPRGLYILDEPESALSPFSQLVFLKHVRRLVEEGSQLILATHAPILLAYPEARLYELDDDGFHSVEYRETSHYQITRAFLEFPDLSLTELFLDGARREGEEG